MPKTSQAVQAEQLATPRLLSAETQAADKAQVLAALNELSDGLVRLDKFFAQLESLGFTEAEINGMPIDRCIAARLSALSWPGALAPVEKPKQLPSLEEVPLWFGVLRDLAVRLGDECNPELGSLVWSIEKLAEKFGADSQLMVSAHLAATKGGCND